MTERRQYDGGLGDVSRGADTGQVLEERSLGTS